jgi:quinone-modifying oxidoreductase subunit QmoB
VTQVSKNGGGLIVDADDTLLGQPIQIKADLVVARHRHGAGHQDAGDQPGLPPGPAFRDNAIFNDYADSNYICFPYETQRTGIYAAGGVRRSMTTESPWRTPPARPSRPSNALNRSTAASPCTRAPAT